MISLEGQAVNIGFSKQKRTQWVAKRRGINIILTIDEKEKSPRYTTPTELIVNSAILSFNGFDSALKASEVLLNNAFCAEIMEIQSA